MDDALAGLEVAHRRDHVDHRPRRVDARLLEVALAHLRRRRARGWRAGEEVVALLGRVREAEDAEAGDRAARRADGAVAADLESARRAYDDRAVLLVEHGLLRAGGDEAALHVDRELAVARVADALRGADGEEAVALERDVER